MAALRNWKTIPRKTLTASPTPLSAVSIICQEFTVQGLATNSADFVIGGPDTTVALSVPRAKSTPHNFYPVDIAGEPKGYDLSKIYVAGTAGDILACQYVSFEE